MDTLDPQEQTVMVLTEVFRLVAAMPLDPLQRDALAQTTAAILFARWQQWQEDQQADAQSKRAWSLLEKAEEAKRRAERRRGG